MRTIGRILALGALLAGWAAPTSAQWKMQIEMGAVDVPRSDLFIENIDTVWTATGEILEQASILIRDGVIRAIGSDLTAPNGVTVIDGRGMTAIPGLVDEHSHTAMRSTNEGSAPVVPEVKVIDALSTEDFQIYQALSGGVTTARILHGSANPIGGQSAVIKMRWGMDDSKKLLLQGAPQSVKFALGENVTQKNFSGGPGPQRFPTSRAGVEAIYVEALTAAQAYKEEWDAYRENPRSLRVPPRRDLRLEALVEIMEGKIRVTAHSYRSDEIVMLMRVAERFGFKIDVFTHVLEGYKVADEMVAHGAAGGTFSDWWQYKLEAYDAIPYNAAVMEEHGVLTSINSDISWLQSFMVYEFNKPVKYGGVSPENALRMLTINPARQMMIDDKVGTLEVGKHGDVVLLSGSPFDSYSRVEKTIIDGIVYYDLQREEETRREAVRSLPQVRLVPDVSPAAQPLGSAVSPATFVGGSGGGLLQQSVTALTGATVHTVSGGDITNGTILIADGRIAAVGSASQVQVPAGANVVDLSGKHVYPGMIDPMTHLGMVEIESVNSSRDDLEVGRYNPQIRALTSVHPHSETIPVARANGITAVLASMGGNAIIPNMGSVIQLAGDTQERMNVSDQAALVVNFPSPTGKAWDEPEIKGERLEELGQLFDRSVEYAQTPSTRRDPTAPFEANVADQAELLLQAMVPAVTGEVPTFFIARRERDIKTLFLFLDKYPDVRAVLVGGDQAFRVADELAARNIPVVVGSAGSPTMDRDDPVSAGWSNAGILYAAGVKVAFGTNDVANVRNLPYHAAKSVAFGLPQEEGLRAVTLNAAEILGLGEEMGSINEGKRADLIVTNGDPLQIVTQVERMFIAGTEVSLESRHTRLWKQFRSRY
ncbi:MAG: amidohydrolase family protein [Gemmatimonadota bacterium]|nr:MAG: amidohydrolase family protein [Gemmatimonadota bacterium]